MLISAILTVGSLFSLIFLKFFPIPYILISIFLSLLFIFLFLFSKESIKKSIWFNLAFLIIILGSIEIYSYFSLNNQKIIHKGSYTQGYFIPNEILGYIPVNGKRVRSKKIKTQKLIYDVTYTIGESGLRISPPFESYNEDQCILFLEVPSLLEKELMIMRPCLMLSASYQNLRSIILAFMDRTSSNAISH